MNRRRMLDRWEDDDKSFVVYYIEKRIYPTLYGGVIGDMLGVPVEFKDRGTFKVEDVTGYGTYNQPPGTWSDDTSLTLCLMENIIEEGNPETLMEKFLKYKEDGYKTPYGRMFDIGIATSNAIWKFKQGTPPENCGGKSEYDNGNGAIMRLAPLAFTLTDEFDFPKKVEIIKKYTEVTHAHPRAIVGSVIYIELLLRLYHNNSLDVSLREIVELFEENFDEDHIYRQELKHYIRIFDKDFKYVSQDEIKSSGYVVHTLEAAIWCLLTTDNFKDAVLKAVNLGDDTDTVGTITGTLAGMYYKMDGIPEEWINKIGNKDEIDMCIYNFYAYCANKEIIEEYGSPFRLL